MNKTLSTVFICLLLILGVSDAKQVIRLPQAEAGNLITKRTVASPGNDTEYIAIEGPQTSSGNAIAVPAACTSGNNCVALLHMNWDSGSASLNSASLGGNSFSEVVTENSNGDERATAWILTNTPAPGNQTLIWSGGGTGTTAFVTFYNYVNRLDAVQESCGESTAFAATITCSSAFSPDLGDQLVANGGAWTPGGCPVTISHTGMISRDGTCTGSNVRAQISNLDSDGSGFTAQQVRSSGGHQAFVSLVLNKEN